MDSAMLVKMSQAAQQLALPDATRVVADYCLKAVNT